MNAREKILNDIEKALFRAYEACGDNIDLVEDLSGFVTERCQELRYIEQNEKLVTRRGDFTEGSCPQMPDVGAKAER